MLKNNANNNSRDYIYDENETINYNEMIRICDLFDINKIEQHQIIGEESHI